MRSATTSGWPFVGRDREVVALRDALGDEGVAAIVLTGDAGSGKTRLAKEITAEAALPPLWWQATAATTGLPHAALSSLVEPEVLADPAALFRRVAGAVADAGGIVVVDDAPHLDARSADLLRRLMDAGKARAIVTARAGVPVPAWLDWLWLDERTLHLDLATLAPDATDELVAEVLPELAADRRHRLANQLHERTAGNALFLRELLAAHRRALDEGEPLAGPAATPAPLRRVLEARVLDAGDDERDLLAALGLFGSLTLDAAASRFGEATVERAERRRLVRVELEGRATLHPTHPLLAEAATGTLSVVARRRVVVELAESILADRAAAPGERLAAVAALLDHGAPAAPADLVDAARLAFAELDHDLAARLAQAAIDAGDPFEAWVVLGAACSGAGRTEEAEAALRSAIEAAADDDQLVRAVGRLSVHLVAHGRRLQEAAELLDGAAARIADPAALAFLDADRAKLASIRGELPTTPAPLPDGDDEAALNALIVGAYAQAMAGDVPGTRAAIARAGELVERHREVLPWSGELVRFSGVLATLAEDGPDAARSEATAGLAQAQDATAGTWRYLHGFAAAVAGRLAEAADALGRAIDELAGHDLIGARPLAVATLAWAQAQGGAVDEARSLLDEALQAGAGDARVEVQAAVADLWCDAVEGSTAGRADKALAAARAAEAGGQLLSAALVLHELARLGGAAEAVAPLRSLAARMPDAWFARFAVARAVAEAAGDADACQRLAREVEAAWPVAAAELWAASSALRSTAGDEVGAARGALRALQAAERLGGPTPWRVRGVTHPLTAREQEVVAAAVAGATSRAMADAAGVSVRTIDNQLQSAYRKLGLRGRSELDAWFPPPA